MLFFILFPDRVVQSLWQFLVEIEANKITTKSHPEHWHNAAVKSTSLIAVLFALHLHVYKPEDL
jgi:hypothetical protein